MTSPVRAGSISEFTPDCFKEIEGAPSFRIKTASYEDKVEIAYDAERLGLSHHDHNDFRREIIAGLKAHYDEVAADHLDARLKAYWDATESQSKIIGELTDKMRADKADDAAILEALSAVKLDFPEDEIPELNEVQDIIVRLHLPLRQMNADNRRHELLATRLYVARLCKGWSNLDVRIVKEGDCLSLDCIDEVRLALGKFEAGAKLPEGDAFRQLEIRCLQATSLTRGEEKN